MKRTTETKNPYATVGTEKIEAPNKPKDEPKATKTVSDKDLRTGRSK